MREPVTPGPLSARLTLIRLIGRGGMGEVWLAEDSVLACPVAVKLVGLHLGLDGRTLERFQKEARGAARVASPHVVRVLDHGVAGERPYIVMEHLQGEDLATHLERVGTLSPVQCARIIGQACRGLARVHEAGLVHRDVKPENLFLVDDGGEPFVKLLDFGLAAEVRSRASVGSIVGTPSYMSPEHTEGGRALVAQSDMWSLAVVAYETLTGALPFDGDGLLSLAMAIQDARFEPPSRHRPDLPRALDAFFEKAFAREPSARFASALEMERALSAAVESAPSPASRPGDVDAPDARDASADRVRDIGRARPRTWRAVVAPFALAVSVGAAVVATRARPETGGPPASTAPPASAPPPTAPLATAMAKTGAAASTSTPAASAVRASTSATPAQSPLRVPTPASVAPRVPDLTPRSPPAPPHAETPSAGAPPPAPSFQPRRERGF